MGKPETSSGDNTFWRHVIIAVAIKILVVGAAIAVVIGYYL